MKFTRKDFKFVSLFLLALLLVVAYPSGSAFAKKKAKTSKIRILTTPGGLLLTIDGKERGETTTEYRDIELEPGVHNVVVRLPNGNLWVRDIDLPAGRVKCVAVNYRPLPPIAKSPCPFPVNVSAPKSVTEGEIITYTADVTYGGTKPLRYNWTISPSSVPIVSGVGTPTISIDSTNLGNQRLIATLVVDDGSGDAACAQTVQVASMVAAEEKKPPMLLKFDECNNCTYDDQKARLDPFAVQLQNDPSTRGYIIAYGGRTSPIGQVEVLMSRARDYLVTERGIDASRLVIVNGGFREADSVELYVVPAGAQPPRPTPTVQAGEVKPAGTGRRRRG